MEEWVQRVSGKLGGVDFGLTEPLLFPPPGVAGLAVDRRCVRAGVWLRACRSALLQL